MEERNKNKVESAGQEETREYMIPNEGCCSAEFAEGCILASNNF